MLAGRKVKGEPSFFRDCPAEIVKALASFCQQRELVLSLVHGLPSGLTLSYTTHRQLPFLKEADTHAKKQSPCVLVERVGMKAADQGRHYCARYVSLPELG